MADEKPRLTARELDVLRLIASGHTYAEAAVRLGISVHTAWAAGDRAFFDDELDEAYRWLVQSMSEDLFAPPVVAEAPSAPVAVALPEGDTTRASRMRPKHGVDLLNRRAGY